MISPRAVAVLSVVALVGCEVSPTAPVHESDPLDVRPTLGFVPDGPVTVGFESFDEGDDVGNPHPLLAIESLDGHDILAIWDEESEGRTGLPRGFAAWSPDGRSARNNGCLTDGAGFAPFPHGVERHRLRFTFTEGATVSEFALRVLDYGDRIGGGETTNRVITMRAYSGDQEVASDVRSGDYVGVEQADACHEDGSAAFGRLDLAVSGSGIDRVDVFMESGGDRLTGYDDLSFTVEPGSLDPTSKADCKNGGWEALAFRNQGRCIRFVNTGKDSRL